MSKTKPSSKWRWRLLVLLYGSISLVTIFLEERLLPVPFVVVPLMLITFGAAISTYWALYRDSPHGILPGLGFFGILVTVTGMLMLLHYYSIVSDIIMIVAIIGLLMVCVPLMLRSHDELYSTVDLSPEQGPVYWSWEPTDLDLLDWKPLFGILRNHVRLRMNETRENVSSQLAEAFQQRSYPSEDPPEVAGLMRVLDQACSKAGVPYRVERGLGSLQGIMVTGFEPYRISLGFEKANLSIYVVWGEFQWVLRNARKERRGAREKLDLLKQEIKEGSKEWLRNGNR